MQHVVEAAEAAAFQQYTAALQALAQPAGHQFDLEDAMAAANRVREWRGIWRATLIEAARRELAAVTE